MNLDEVGDNLTKECQVSPGTRIVVGVSGGPDSLCLLDVLARLGYDVLAAHFNHQLRPEAGRDAAMVSQTAAALNVPFLSSSADVAAWAADNRQSIEEAARSLRYRFLFDCARAENAQAVAVGHTADDQVETVLMHLLRGAGLPGLKGMLFRTILPEWHPTIALIRPLLAVWREETLSYCQNRSLAYVIDATNQDTTYYRNRLRHELIPYLQTYNSQAKAHIWQMSRLLAGEEQIVQAAVQQAWDASIEREQAGYVAFRLDDLRARSVPLQRSLLRRAIGYLRPVFRNVDSAAVERGIDFIRDLSRSGRMDLLQGLYLVHEPRASGSGLLMVVEESLLEGGGVGEEGDWPQLAADNIPLSPPATIPLGSGWQLESRWLDLLPGENFQPGAANRWEAFLCAGTCRPPMLVRRQQPGDRFQPLGMDGHSMKLSNFWINEKLPRRARAAWPLVCCGDQIAWIPGFRPAHPFRIQPGAERVLYLRLQRMENKPA